jgi:beta-glucosidase/6-phospho-beta-glucosidase/beta-galactosidase
VYFSRRVEAKYLISSSYQISTEVPKASERYLEAIAVDLKCSDYQILESSFVDWIGFNSRSLFDAKLVWD